MYIKDVPHQQIIAAEVIAALYTHGINVEPMPVDKDTYNARHCDYLGDPNGTFPYWYSCTQPGAEYEPSGTLARDLGCMPRL